MAQSSPASDYAELRVRPVGGRRGACENRSSRAGSPYPTRGGKWQAAYRRVPDGEDDVKREAPLASGQWGFWSVHGRYKTRTCDLHDVNVAL